MKVGAVVLAAGGSTRLGQPKQLLRIEGETLVRRTTRAALTAGCQPVVVVLGSAGNAVSEELKDLPVIFAPNDSWSRGIGSSIRTGLGATGPCDAVVVLVCDQPRMDARVIQSLISEQKKTARPIVASAYAGTLGVPALFKRDLFAALLSLPDEQGAKTIIDLHPAKTATVDFPEGAIDVDTPEDFRHFPNEVRSS